MSLWDAKSASHLKNKKRKWIEIKSLSVDALMQPSHLESTNSKK